MNHIFQHQEVQPTEEAYVDGYEAALKDIQGILQEFGRDIIFKIDKGSGNVEIVYNIPRNYFVSGEDLKGAILNLIKRKERLGIKMMIN